PSTDRLGLEAITAACASEIHRLHDLGR
ncbi:1-acyl-sn-glycerol-3-phosphate acyltransferase, partial [filamentous cyanobacterium CCP3]